MEPTVTPYINPTTFPAARFGDINTLTGLMTPLLMTGAALLFGGMLLLMAYKWLTAGSDQEQVTQARNIGTYAVLGLILVLTAYVIVKIVGFILGINIPI
ncbi:MAG TPA: hypothetical protein PLS49_03095 [Candidatus Woesebacteria bacterium]|nr:hypothetical protein [Candidatus Woesebacteria bacterium]